MPVFCPVGSRAMRAENGHDAHAESHRRFVACADPIVDNFVDVVSQEAHAGPATMHCGTMRLCWQLGTSARCTRVRNDGL